MPKNISEGSLLWQPTPTLIENANLTHYRNWLAAQKGVITADYPALWRWSVAQPGAFWGSLWDYFGVRHSAAATTPLADATMPGAVWFPGARLNYAENIFAQQTDQHPMLLYQSETEALREISWAEAHAQTQRLAHVLRGLGVGRGDRVVAFMPNLPQTIIAFLAVASLGAVWSSCSPDFGSRSVLDRFSQIEPKILLAVEGYHYGGKYFDRRGVVAELQAALPSLQKTILIGENALPHTLLWQDALAAADAPPLTFEQVPFDHPLWVLYSSGTTGLPKPIVHGHGGIVLEHLKTTVLHNNLKRGDRFFWYTSTGWMMWNYLVGSLFSGATALVYHGSPDPRTLFEFAAHSGMNYFGTSAAFISACMKSGMRPSQEFDLSQIQAVGSTGSPLTIEGFAWVYENVNAHLALESLSGGTDVCTAFVGGARTLPIYAGEIQGAALGAMVQAYNDAGEPVIDEVGELVITQPMPSMPLYFWNDPDMQRYRASYFDTFPGVWRHGDWIRFNQRGGCVIYGRSDSTINRQGIRMGTSEIYRVVEAFEEILDSLIIDLELLGRASFMPLFVVLRPGYTLTDDLKARIQRQLRADVSPRHVPDEIIQIEDVPYTLSGKKMEVPIRKILLGLDTHQAANPGAMRNPDSLAFFVAYAEKLARL